MGELGHCHPVPRYHPRYLGNDGYNVYRGRQVLSHVSPHLCMQTSLPWQREVAYEEVGFITPGLNDSKIIKELGSFGRQYALQVH